MHGYNKLINIWIVWSDSATILLGDFKITAKNECCKLIDAGWIWCC